MDALGDGEGVDAKFLGQRGKAEVDVLAWGVVIGAVEGGLFSRQGDGDGEEVGGGKEGDGR